MTTEYILTHTPRQIAGNHTPEEIETALHYELDEDTICDIIGHSDSSDWIDWTGEETAAACAQLLVEWYGTEDEERPFTAEEMATALTVYAAWQLSA